MLQWSGVQASVLLDPILVEAYERAMGNAMLEPECLAQQKAIDKAQAEIKAQIELVKAWDSHAGLIRSVLEDYGANAAVIAAVTNPKPRLDAQTKLDEMRLGVFRLQAGYFEKIWSNMEKLEPRLKPFLGELRILLENAQKK